MPSIWSKIFMPDWNVSYNCYELGHTWTPYCSEAALEVGYVVFVQSLKLYAPLYLASQVLKRKFDKKSLKKCGQSILRSSAFLGINAFLVIGFFCLSRQILGRFYYTLCAYIPSFLGSFMAIFIERSMRRRALAFYVANIGSETLFRILLSRGYIEPIPNGQFWLFSFTVSILFYLYETGRLQDSLLNFIFGHLVGKNSNAVSKETSNDLIEEQLNDETNGGLSWWTSVFSRCDQFWLNIKRLMPVLNYRHTYCSHAKESSCFEKIVFQSFFKSLFLGCLSQLALKAAGKILSGRFQESVGLFRWSKLMSRRNAMFGLFLSSFTTVYQSIRCFLCYATNKVENSKHSLIAAMLASPAMFLAPNTSLTLYLVWKCVEACFNHGVKQGWIKYDQFLIPLLYALATSQLFYSAVLDPSHIKPSYIKFLNRVTQNHLKYINRNVLEVFGTKASSGFESVLPIYDLKYTTRCFQESVLVWLL